MHAHAHARTHAHTHAVSQVGVVRNVDAMMYTIFLDIYYNRSPSGSKFSLEGGGGAGQVSTKSA